MLLGGIINYIRPSVPVLAFAVALGCAGGEATDSGDTQSARPGNFDDFFVRVGTIEPDQSDSSPIVRVSGIAFAPDGRFVVADASEGNVRMFRSDGSLLRVFGRKGQGPGEFVAPRYLSFVGDSLLYVGDGQQAQISIFRQSGEFLGRIQVDGLSIMTGFGLLPEGDIIVAGPSLDRSNQNVVHVLDPSGVPKGAFLPIRDVLPAGVKDSPVWQSIRTFHVGLLGSRVHVASTLSDSLWIVDFATGQTEAIRLDLPGIVAPEEAPKTIRNISELSQFGSSFHRAVRPVPVGEILVIPFVQGILNYGDPGIVAMRDRAGAWHALDGAPPAIGSWGERLIAIDNPLEDPVRFAVYEVRTK